MTDAISPRLQTPSRASYQSEGVREVQARARFIEHAQSPQEQEGLKRLDRMLRHGGTPDRSAPRGFYLNINV